MTLAAFGPLTAGTFPDSGPLADGNKVLVRAIHSVPQYEFELIDAPGKDPTYSWTYTFINNSGMIGQDYIDTAGNPHYAVGNGNTWQVVEVPEADVRSPETSGEVWGKSDKQRTALGYAHSFYRAIQESDHSDFDRCGDRVAVLAGPH